MTWSEFNESNDNTSDYFGITYNDDLNGSSIQNINTINDLFKATFGDTFDGIDTLMYSNN